MQEFRLLAANVLCVGAKALVAGQCDVYAQVIETALAVFATSAGGAGHGDDPVPGPEPPYFGAHGLNFSRGVPPELKRQR
jgi:hypothetical protein